MIVCDKEDFTTTNYGFSFKLLIYIVFPRYSYCISLSPRQLSSLNDSKIEILFNL